MPYVDNREWDDAIEQSPEIGIVGDRTSDDRPSTAFLHRPGQLICDSRVWNQPANSDEENLRESLVARGASETRSDPRLPRDDLRAAAAETLGLTLLNVEGDVLDVVREGRRFVAGGLSYNQVSIADPQRHGGCSAPRPLPGPTVEIPGSPGTQGAGKTVAVLDTGIVENAPFGVDPASDIEPSTGGAAARHGTMVAALIARFLPGANILVKQVLNMPLGDADELEIAAALDALQPVDVINASFGGRAADDARMLAFERAVGRLPRQTLVVSSAGNEGLNRPHYMAAFKRVVAVASVEVVERDPQICDYSNRGHWVDFCTQGSDVETLAGPDEAVLASGTSFAAPKVAAAIVKLAEARDIGVRHAASLLNQESGGPPVIDGGTFVDIPAP